MSSVFVSLKKHKSYCKTVFLGKTKSNFLLENLQIGAFTRIWQGCNTSSLICFLPVRKCGFPRWNRGCICLADDPGNFLGIPYIYGTQPWGWAYTFPCGNIYISKGPFLFNDAIQLGVSVYRLGWRNLQLKLHILLSEIMTYFLKTNTVANQGSSLIVLLSIKQQSGSLSWIYVSACL